MRECAFCGKPKNEVKRLLETDRAAICSKCVASAVQALGGESQPTATKKEEKPLLRPKEIMSWLEQFVISQNKAKRDIAVAVYNHYKRREAVRKGLIAAEELGKVEIQKSNILLLGPSGCHRRGQKVLMFDGTLKAVEDVQVGDWLMGPDSTPRTVLELHRGVEEMVEIVPYKGDPWVVNQGHILTLVRTSYNGGSGYRPAADVVDVPLRKYLEWSATQKACHKLFRVGVNFHQEVPLLVDPYFLGVLLGDGCLRNRIAVTTDDPEIRACVEENARRWELSVSVEAEGTTSATYHLSTGRIGGGVNPLREALKGLGVFGSDSESKFIPLQYKVASAENRLRVLAGLIDTDGSLSCGGYDFVSKSQALANDVAFVARSVGLAAYVKPCAKKAQTGAEGRYFRVFISGCVSRIPVRIPRKKAGPREQAKDVLRTGFTTRALPAEDYFGFVLDGDHRFLLDDFTVTHNTGKTEIARGISRMLGVPFYVADATKLTQAGYVGDDVESMLQGLIGDAGGDIERAEWGIIFIDEIDKLARKSGRSVSGSRDVTGEGVQQALLKLVEGSKVIVPRGMNRFVGEKGADVIDTANILFVGAGSFAGIEDVVTKRVNQTTSIGFGSGEGKKKLKMGDVYLQVVEEDILEFGLIPELMGRFPVLTTTLPLTEEELVRILTEPKNALVKQFKALMAMDGISLVFETEALKAVGREAQKRPTGARALRSILEDLLRDYTFEHAGDPSVKVIQITQDVVEKRAQANIVRGTEQPAEQAPKMRTS